MVDWSREVLAKKGATITAVMSVVTALIAFGIINWTDAQIEAFQAVLVAVIPLIINAVAIVAVGRRDVTPVDDPRSRDGEPLVPISTVRSSRD